MTKFEILKGDDDRNEVADFANGIYYIVKNKTVGTVSFGKGGHHATPEEAYQALHNFLAYRKDRAQLTVTLVDRS